jgi:sugar/nucleoside kinase (ribokinase family)
MSRSGILAGGNFIVDYVKMIDHYPAENMLASISGESHSNGGGPYNILKDLAAMKAGIPLAAAGMVGDDPNGRWILSDCQSHGIDTALLRTSKHAPTSYTDAMTVASTGRRTFFHQRGANALLDVDHFDFSSTKARIFHLAYLMLLDSLDQFDPSGRTRASIVVAKAREAGLETSVDIVSTENPRFREIALSTMPYADHLVINEIESGKILGRKLAVDNIPAMKAAAEELLTFGVGKTVVIHFESGAVAAQKNSATIVQGSLQLPQGFSQGATGAGDAFAAGYLLGTHEGWPLVKRLELGVCAAAACLTHPSASSGLRPVADCLALEQKYPARVF